MNAGGSMAILIARQCSGTMRGASPDGAHPGLHSKPLDAVISQVPAPYRLPWLTILVENTKH
jgi:hypothetical protein